MSLAKPAVNLKLMQRRDESQYFEVWVRSESQPRRQLGIIVERGFQESTKIECAAALLAEEIGEKWHDNLIDPSLIAKAAVSSYISLNMWNPRPQLGDEEKLEG